MRDTNPSEMYYKFKHLRNTTTISDMKLFLSNYTDELKAFDDEELIEAVVVLRIMEDEGDVFFMPENVDTVKLVLRGLFKLVLHDVLEVSLDDNEVLIHKGGR